MLVPVVDMKLTGQNIATLRTQRGISVRDLQHMLGFTRHSPSINGNGVKPFLPLKTWRCWHVFWALSLMLLWLWNAGRREAEMDKRCVLFTGLQASGKTTFWQQRFPDIIHVNLDTQHTRNKERQLLEDCFSSGTSFVVDNTNPTRKDRERYIVPAKENGYRIIGYYFQSSISACIERNLRREGKARLPDVALMSVYTTLELPAWEEGYDELYYVRIDQDRFVIEPWKVEEKGENHDEV